MQTRWNHCSIGFAVVENDAPDPTIDRHHTNLYAKALAS
jgi:hypothetical protein